MNAFDLGSRRLESQLIAWSDAATPREVVEKLGAVQAQDCASALWALGLRMGSAGEQTVVQALRDGSVVRAWLVRGTLHFVAADDLRWMLALVAPRLLARSGRRRKQLELDDETLTRAEELVTEALRDGATRTRGDLMQMLDECGVATGGQRGYHMLWWMGQRSVICFGPRDGSQDTFVLLDSWVPESRSLHRDEALAELARRYFSGHGPASLKDFTWWSGLTAGEAREGLKAIEAELERVEIDDQMYWFAPSALASDADSPLAHLLPAFDEYLIGYRHRDAVLDPEYAYRVAPGGGVFRPVFELDGQVVGTWRRVLQKRSVSVSIDPFHSLDDEQRELAEVAAHEYGRFVEMPVEFDVVSV